MMKKSLLAVAVAAALPAMAQAQTNTTLSGYFKLNLANNSYSSTSATPSTSGTGLMEGSSRFVISGSEDLGGGLKAIYRFDQRFKPDNATSLGSTGSTPIGGGATWMGLQGNWGTFKVGRQDLHYYLGTDDVAGNALPLQYWNVSLLSFVGNGSVAIANTSRTSNVLRYESNNMGGFTGAVSYTFSPLQAQEYQAGLSAGNVGNKGSGFQLEGAYNAGPISAFATYWSGKNPTTSAGAPIYTLAGVTSSTTQLKQESWRIGGSYNFGVAKVGLTIDDSSYTTGTTAASTKNQRSAWSLPVVVPMGAGQVLFTYTSAGKVKSAGTTVADSGASMIMLGYNYDLSKRTAVGAGIARISNKANASYAMFTGAALGDTNAPAAGQNVTSVSLGMIHRF